MPDAPVVQRWFASQALLEDGWRNDVVFTVTDGVFTSIEPDASPGDAWRLSGPAVPGMANLHSHAFQRAIAGLTERAGPGSDSFWTWREAMYRSLDRLGPDELQALAAWLYAECLERGYTAVGEFHYVHRTPHGELYADPAELSLRVVQAARAAGIGLTMLPVLYQQGGIGQAPTSGQRRFVLSTDEALRLVERLRQEPGVTVGLAPHSLRAVSREALSEATQAVLTSDPDARLHIHVSEQVAEVEAVRAAWGQTPIAALHDLVGLDPRWCLVHATHATAAEVGVMAASGCVAGLCPTTEASLGDGIFDARSYLAEGGSFGVGTDSQVSRCPFSELRLLELGQRLVHRQRNVLRLPGGAHTGAQLWVHAARGGARALGRGTGALAVGSPADLVTLSPRRPDLTGDTLLDAAVFVEGDTPVSSVWVGGTRVVERGRHVRKGALQTTANAALRRLGLRPGPG